MDWVRAGMRVRVIGEKDRFTVLRVDRERYAADLLREGAVCKVESGVRLSLLRPAEEPDAVGEGQLGVSA